MLTNEIRSQIDQIWNAFWSGGISNPLEVIEQITYLLFLKRLDEQEIAEAIEVGKMVRQGAASKMDRFAASLNQALPSASGEADGGCGCGS